MYTEWINQQGNTKQSFEDKGMKRWANFTKPTSDMDSLTMKGHINQLKAGLIMQFIFAWFHFNMLKIYSTFWMYAIIFALTWFGIGDTL